MSREWKPGDVAMVRWGRYPEARAMYLGERGWLDVDNAAFDGDEDGLTIRPLVVIDPEDLAQVERLVGLFEAARGESLFSPDRPHFATALREFANPTPPKPAEPTGLGAVIEDAGGERWIRAARIAHGWHRPMGKWAAYAEINAVRVLSEGVAP